MLPRTAHLRGDGVSLCRIRHALRFSDAKAAEAEALPLIETASASLFWPYLSLAWRILGDERVLWLDQPDTLIQKRDDILSPAELAELADLLRALHTAQAPYIEQSVRGGTQTDRSILLRHEPILQRTRNALLGAIDDYVAFLPPADSTHPILAQPRDRLLIEGSWSVRLLGEGHNVPHTHPKGWISTAFYVSLPDTDQLGPVPAGHIALGSPPTELGLNLKPYTTIEPRIGRLAIFPSTMWHSTIPFEQGERLVIAFDVRTA
jgi:hypothetical protein